MTKAYTVPSIDEYLRERLMPVEGAIPHIPGIEMFGNSVPACENSEERYFRLWRTPMPKTTNIPGKRVPPYL
jgi:hypothetical protein